MDSYSIRWKQSAAKELRALSGSVVPRIVRAVETLATDPHPPGSKKLRGSEHTYRLRVGDYRVVYSVLASMLVIEVIRVGHRSRVYRGQG